MQTFSQEQHERFNKQVKTQDRIIETLLKCIYLQKIDQQLEMADNSRLGYSDPPQLLEAKDDSLVSALVREAALKIDESQAGVNDKLEMIKAEVTKLAGTQRLMAERHRQFESSLKSHRQNPNDIDTAELQDTLD